VISLGSTEGAAVLHVRRVPRPLVFHPERLDMLEPIFERDSKIL